MSVTALARRGYARLTTMRGETAVMLLVLVLLSMAVMAVSYHLKSDCTGAPFHPDGRSAWWASGHDTAGHPYGNQLIPCYTDIQSLWIGRDINNHVFPYIHGGITEGGQLYGGVVEYPVLSGVLMYLGAIGAHTDYEFLAQSALLLAPFGILTTILLGLLVRWWALIWVLAPPLLLYSFHNWELPVVFTSVAAIAIVVFGESTNPKTGQSRIPLRTSACVAAILLALGFCLKLYPGLFVLPLALYVLTGGRNPVRPKRSELDIRGSLAVIGTAAVTAIAVNLPFMIAGYTGWKASLDFQGKRKAVIDTNSIWYWGLRHLTDGMTPTYNSLVGVLSPLLVVLGFALAMWLGIQVWLRGNPFPWIGASGSMLCAFIVLHKVDSPQYTLWILPFFLLLRVPWSLVIVYLLADFALDVNIFRMFGIDNAHQPMKWWVMFGVQFGVWGRVVVLLAMLVLFIRAAPRYRQEFGPARILTREPAQPSLA
ncbi:hypothetical protein [Jongsikchunia kroppenstedtii]|uniref:hypothetical protein n=1 Tax=Jongsikchunia kroppenstedtii TaxID=1121721 RepID=UPI000363001D|nr:hypothetical protein [Jongsikchunia kroppenstedtii]